MCLSVAAELAEKWPMKREPLVLAETEHHFIDGAGGVGKLFERKRIGKRLADQWQVGANHPRRDAGEQSDGLGVAVGRGAPSIPDAADVQCGCPRIEGRQYLMARG